MTNKESLSGAPSSVEQFFALIEADPRLQERLVDVDLDEACVIAGEFGIELEPKQLLAYSEKNYTDQEASDSELKAAAGGVSSVKLSPPSYFLKSSAAGLKI